jgi:hypothetical protein
MPAVVWYAVREDVKAATDSPETARNNRQIDRALAAGTDSVERLLCRRFYPEVDTRSFDYPNHADPEDAARTLPLGRDELVAYTELRVDDVAVASGHITLLPDRDDEPVAAVELDSTVTLSGDTERRAVEIDGTFGYWDREDPAGTLASPVADGATTAVTVSDSAAIGVGQLLLVGAERMIVDRKSMVDTGQDTAGALDASNKTETLAVASGAAFVEGEVILVDAEKMLVVEIAGNTLIVKRAWDGSTIAAHNSGVDVYAPRRLTVRRGVLGTAAVAHNAGTAVTKHQIPALVNQLCIAEALIVVAQEGTGYGRTIGSGDSERDAPGAGIEDLRRRTWEAYGRRDF